MSPRLRPWPGHHGHTYTRTGPTLQTGRDQAADLAEVRGRAPRSYAERAADHRSAFARP